MEVPPGFRLRRIGKKLLRHWIPGGGPARVESSRLAGRHPTNLATTHGPLRPEPAYAFSNRFRPLGRCRMCR